MKDAEQELESGFYWVRWCTSVPWQPAQYDSNTQTWLYFGFDFQKPSLAPPVELGPRIPQYEDTL